MRIGLNGQRILMDNPAGPEKYTINLFKGLATIDHDNDYVLYLDKEPNSEFINNIFQGNDKFTYKVINSKFSWTQWGLAKELMDNPIDVLFTAVHTMPILKLSNTKVVAMIHGLEYKYSKGYSNPLKKFLLNKPEWYVCTFADKLIVPSQSTKNEILKRRWASPNKITLIPEGVSKDFHKRSAEETSIVREKFGIGDSKYLFFISTIQPRKNIPNMVEGYANAVKRIDNDNSFLVIAGKNGWDFEESLKAPEKFGVSDKVKIVGRVTDEEAYSLMSGARAYINLSLEEGFGLPLLEAMSSEVETIVSDIPAHNELGRNFPIYVDPKDIGDISRGIYTVLTNEKDLEKIKEAKEHANNFSWENSAEKTLSVLKQVIKNL